MQAFFTRLSRWLASNRNWALLIVLALAVKVFSLFPAGVETYYTYGAYPFISRLQRTLLGWIPLSIGDLLYTAVLILLLVRGGRALRRMARGRLTRAGTAAALRNGLFWILFVYVWFNLLWGLNYDRQGIARQLRLEMKTYTLAQLDTLTGVLEERLNFFAADSAAQRRAAFYSKRNLFREAAVAYQAASATYPFLTYVPRSIKPSLFSYLGNILGFQGYYNPFSGEGQVNTTIPVFMQPFVACHEIGHQLGYAKENEANFAGFLACRRHPSPVFRYSVYFDMYNYAIGELYQKDSVAARRHLNQLHPQVRADFREMNRFFDRYRNPLEPLVTWFYGRYLRANNQPAGHRTYSEVVAFLIAYQRTYGMESL